MLSLYRCQWDTGCRAVLITSVVPRGGWGRAPLALLLGSWDCLHKQYTRCCEPTPLRSLYNSLVALGRQGHIQLAVALQLQVQDQTAPGADAWAAPRQWAAGARGGGWAPVGYYTADEALQLHMRWRQAFGQLAQVDGDLGRRWPQGRGGVVGISLCVRPCRQHRPSGPGRSLRGRYPARAGAGSERSTRARASRSGRERSAGRPRGRPP
jgi:hypothetical protein